MKSTASRPCPLSARSSRRGFTLVEVLIASVVLATSVVGAMGAFSASSRARAIAQFDLVATQLAQGKMAETRAVTDLPLGESDGDFGEQYPDFTWHLNVQPVTDLAITDQEQLQGLFQIDLTVTGRALGRPRSLNFSTYTM